MDSIPLPPHKVNVRKQSARQGNPASPGAVKDHVRLRLLRAARDLLSALGSKGATARAICDRAGVRAPTLYYYFGDLTRLHAAAVNASFVEIMAGYRQRSRSSGTLEAIRQAWDTLVRFGRTEPVMARLLILSVLDDKPPAALRLTLARLTKDLRDMEATGGLKVSADDAVAILWTAAIGATTMATSLGRTDARKGGPSDMLLDDILAAIITPVDSQRHEAQP
jgi:AcrR family transcriptional regulator